jgi:hypothetical protein
MHIDEEEPPPLLVDVDGKEEDMVEGQSPLKVPITIVTGKSHQSLKLVILIEEIGYLGAGKTTLMNYILNEQHGKKIAVILNGRFRECRSNGFQN